MSHDRVVEYDAECSASSSQQFPMIFTWDGKIASKLPF
jgi:hypothetical protein